LNKHALNKRTLGVDLGLVRTGLAVSDELGITTRALPNLSPRSRAQDVAALVAVVVELEVHHVVIGHALLPKSGDEGPMAKRARGFAEAMQAALDAANLTVKVHLIDEAGSSKRAAQRLVETAMQKTKRKAALDSESARVLVEDYLSSLP
jgi:putative Holliday junction resolvase